MHSQVHGGSFMKGENKGGSPLQIDPIPPVLYLRHAGENVVSIPSDLMPSSSRSRGQS